MPNEPVIKSLRSIELAMPEADAAVEFFSQIWGLRVASKHGKTTFLSGTGSDPYLIAIREAPKVEIESVSLRAHSEEGLKLAQKVASTAWTTALKARHHLDEHGGGEAIVLRDPQGRNVRVVFNDALKQREPDHPDRPVRLAHAVLNSVDVAGAQPFYEQILGCVMSDRTGIMSFLRFPQNGSGDHHSIALADADNNCLNHIAFVMPSLEAVMRGGGRMQDAGYPIEWGPGRHGPGDNAFNYFVGPSGVPIEYTAEVEQVDDSYCARGPADWKWPSGRYDHWGISAPPSARLKDAQRKINFANLI